MAVSVRARIREIQAKVRDEDLDPVALAIQLTKLTALYGNVLDEMRVADSEYNAVLVDALNSGGPVNRALIRAKGTPQYQRVREAKDTAQLSLELIRSLKKFLTLQAEEIRR